MNDNVKSGCNAVRPDPLMADLHRKLDASMEMSQRLLQRLCDSCSLMSGDRENVVRDNRAHEDNVRDEHTPERKVEIAKLKVDAIMDSMSYMDDYISDLQDSLKRIF